MKAYLLLMATILAERNSDVLAPEVRSGKDGITLVRLPSSTTGGNCLAQLDSESHAPP